MKTKTRNIIAISVVCVALIIIVTVVALALVRIDPMKDMRDASGFKVYYGNKQCVGYSSAGADGISPIDKAIPSINQSPSRKYDELSAKAIMDMTGFSVFQTMFQFKYDNDYALTSEGALNRDQIKTIVSGSADELKNTFSLHFSFDEDRTITVSSDDGTEYAQSYNRAIVVLSDTGASIGNIKMYVYNNANLFGDFPLAEFADDTIGIFAFYPIQFGASTNEAVNALADIFNIDLEADTDESDNNDDDNDDATEYN